MMGDVPLDWDALPLAAVSQWRRWAGGGGDGECGGGGGDDPAAVLLAAAARAPRRPARTWPSLFRPAIARVIGFEPDSVNSAGTQPAQTAHNEQGGFSPMFQTVIHGRGGQGVVTASELLARSAFSGGAQVQAIPSFGSERMGAPVVAYTRFSSTKILTREPISRPDAVIIQDPTLLGAMNPFEGLVVTGMAVVNTRLSPNQVRDLCQDAPRQSGRLATVPADDIVREYLGRPIPSAALLGAFAALTAQVSLEAVTDSINQLFKGKVASGNIASAQVAYQWVIDHRGQDDQGAPNGIEPVEVDRPTTAELPRVIAGTPEVTNA